MQATDDSALLRQYVENHSDEAFALLVAQHINLVYSVALRQVGNPHQAEEITQAVFIVLAKKAAELRHNKALSSWLFQAAHLTANNFVRSEIRRHYREQEAFMQSGLNESGTGIWASIAPSLDTAVAGLNEKDRRAIVLRFYEGRNLREVGVALGASEEAAKKRVTRALEKLQRFFLKHGVTSTTEILAGAISANSVQAAPVALAKSVSAVAMTKGVAASGSTLTLIKGALKIMAWTKAKTIIVVGAGVLLATGTATVTVKEIHDYRMYSWEVPNPNIGLLEQAPPQVTIFPAKFLKSGGGGWAANNGRVLGISAGIMDMLEAAYTTQSRMVIATELPQKRYDFIANLPNGTAQTLQAEIKKRFGLVGRREMIETNVLILTVRHSNAPGLKPNRTGGHNNNPQFGEYSCVNQPISALTYFLELYLGTPVIDRTGLAGRFDMNVKWDDTDKANRNVDGLKQALLDQLGLELVPSREPIEMLVVEKVK